MEANQRGATVQPTISEAELEVVQTLVEEDNDALLWELGERLRERSGIRVSVTTMHRALKRLRLRRKKKTLYASEQDTPRIQQMRHAYRRWLEQIDIRNLVFVAVFWGRVSTPK